jgi:predicted enzyme related to lactoylglutathione lyase
MINSFSYSPAEAAVRRFSVRTTFRRGLGITLSGVVLAACAGSDSAQMNPYSDFGITANNAFFYYADLKAATEFYTQTLGIEIAADYGFAKILHVAGTSFLTLVDADSGMHSADEPKTVALALVTDQLEAWWDYLSATDTEMRFEFNYREDRPHDGFVAIDPEGYLLEFERFNPHEENEKFIPVLQRAETKFATGSVPEGLGFKATVVWTYYNDLDGAMAFYEDKFGLDMIVDQGWTKIYQTSTTGFLGLVDQERGMHRATEQKGVTLSFWTDDIDSWFVHASGANGFEMRSDSVGRNDRFHAFVGYDVEGYYLEFDTFLPHEHNERLLVLIGG